MKTVAEDLNSPVRKFVNFVCANVSRMHAILSSHGVESPDEPLTKETLDKVFGDNYDDLVELLFREDKK